MTTIRVWKSNNNIKAFEACGHAGYARFGKDIVCSAISVLLTTTINSIDELCKDQIEVTADNKTGLMRCVFANQISNDALLLVNSMILGLKQIQNEYGKKYIDIIIEEV